MRANEVDWLSVGESRTTHIMGALACHHEVIQEDEGR